MAVDPFIPPRAGFWRRLGALSIDIVATGLVVAVLGSLAYAASRGRVQTGPFGIVVQACRGVSTIPEGLAPPPLVGSNYASDCTAGSFPGLPMMHTLVVGRQITSEGREERTWRSYPLGTDGAPVAAFDATLIGELGFVVYLAACLLRRGRTLGLRLLGARLVANAHPTRAGVPFRPLVIRTAVIVAGFIPTLLIGAVALVWAKTDLAHAPILMLTGLALLAAAGWIGWNAILVARKVDPVYDRVARLAVLLDRPAERTDAFALRSGVPQV